MTTTLSQFSTDLCDRAKAGSKVAARLLVAGLADDTAPPPAEPGSNLDDASRARVLDALGLAPDASLAEILATLAKLGEATPDAPADSMTSEPAPPDMQTLRALARGLRLGCRVGTPRPGCEAHARGRCDDCQRRQHTATTGRRGQLNYGQPAPITK